MITSCAIVAISGILPLLVMVFSSGVLILFSQRSVSRKNELLLSGRKDVVIDHQSITLLHIVREGMVMPAW